jgi:hypothetical protein
MPSQPVIFKALPAGNKLPQCALLLATTPTGDQQTEFDMKYLLAAASLALVLATAAQAQMTPSCKAQATEKKLAGAALKSFSTKCEKDAQAMCDKSASDKKLAGAAKTSHLKKCMADSKG